MPPARFEPAFPAGEQADLFLRTLDHRNQSDRDNTSNTPLQLPFKPSPNHRPLIILTLDPL